MANGLINARQYGGPDEIVEDPSTQSQRLQAPDTGNIIEDTTTPAYQPTQSTPLPTSADLAPADRNIAAEQNWIKKLQDIANRDFTDPNEREDYLERAIRYTRNNIAMQQSANRQILQHDRDSIDKVIDDYKFFQGRGPRNDYEAYQINPGWADMKALAVQHKPELAKYIADSFASNSRMDVPETTERTNKFENLLRIVTKAQQGDPSVDRWRVQQKVGEDLPGYDLSKRQQGIIKHELGVLKSQKDIDNQTGHYMQVVGGMLNDAGIPANSPLVEQLKGALTYELKQHQRTKEDPGAPIDDNDVRSITAGLLRHRASTGYYESIFGTLPRFQVPDGWFTEENRQQFFEQYKREPIAEDIYAKYLQWKANQAR